MISDEVWDKVREAWRETIPEQYRFTDKERGIASQQDPHFSSAIILPPPPAHMLASFFAQFTPHLTKAQLAARAARENCGRPGVRKGEPWTPPAANRSRAKPSLAPVPAGIQAPHGRARAVT